MQLFFLTINKLFGILLAIVTLFKLLLSFYRCKIKKNFKVLLAQDPKIFYAVSSLKASSYWDTLEGISFKYHHFAYNKVNLNEKNFFYFEMNLTEVQKKINECNFVNVKKIKLQSFN